MKKSPGPVRIFGLAPALAVLTAAACLQTSAQTATNVYVQHNLVSDVPGLADVTDPNLIDPWGIAISAASPFWVSVNGKATLYNGAGTITPLVVTVPAGARGPAKASVSGQVSNPTAGFVLPAAHARLSSSLPRMGRFPPTRALLRPL